MTTKEQIKSEVDTAGWGHLVDPSQAFHAHAAEIYRSGRHH